MIDSVTLATITSAVTVLGVKVAEGAAGEAGKLLWSSVKKLLGWKSEPNAGEIAQRVAEQIQEHPEYAAELMHLLEKDSGPVGMLVGQINAEKVVVSKTINVVNM
ncbi:MAG TPA: hypothetical protein VI685_03425 [Candidatus Angelobacter sp.]